MMTPTTLTVEQAAGQLAARLNHGAPDRLITPGIYFGFPEDRYHADPALGSTNHRQLATNPCDYWWNSAMNPAQPRDNPTVAKTRGTAIHVLAFYGEDAFDRRYMRGAQHDPEMTAAEKGALTKAANASAKARGLIALPADDYDRIITVTAMVMKNPELGVAFRGGMAEVSVFWEADGVRKKARLDYLKPRGLGDLKSVTNQSEGPFPNACIRNITNYRYDMQAGHYIDARRQIPRLVADGCVYGDHDPALLKEIVTTSRWGWQWVFWQAERAPITWSRNLTPAHPPAAGNPLLEVSDIWLRRAVLNYKEYLQRWGTEMWINTDKPTELYQEDLPSWWAKG